VVQVLVKATIVRGSDEGLIDNDGSYSNEK
jgi:hypothetical protein